MKETVLAKILVESLGISPNSADGNRLLNWRRPDKSEIQGKRSVQVGIR
jgi:hypothetical protein